MAESPWEFRPFAPAHLPELTDLWVASWHEAMPEIDFEARRGWLVDHLGALIEAGTMVELAFARSTGALAGFVTVDCANGHVDQLAVHPGYWGGGAAEALIRSAAAHAGRPLTLDVNAENPRAVRFYRKIGFTVIGQGANERSGRPTLRMEWRPDLLIMGRQ